MRLPWPILGMAQYGGPAPFGRLAYGGVDKLAGHVVAANAQGLMVWTLPCNVGARVGHVT